MSRSRFKKILIISFAAHLLIPTIALAASCCVCLITDPTGMENDQRIVKKNQNGMVITDSLACQNASDTTGYSCKIEENEKCVEPSAPVTTKLEEDFKFSDMNTILGIKIPNLNFSAPPSEIDEEGNIYIPWIGEYIKAIYNFALVAISIIAVVVLIVQGARIIISAGGPEKTNAYKGITGAVIGLFIAWGSYVILFSVNPNLVQFRSLKIKFIEGIEMEFVDNSELSIESSSQTPTEATIQSADDLWQTLDKIKGDNMIGAICGEKATCGRADGQIAKIFKEAAKAIADKNCVVIYAAGARKPKAQLDKVKKRCKWSETDKTYVDCGVALGRWGTTSPAPTAGSQVCRYTNPDTPLPPCDMNALLHYKAIDAWATNADTTGACKETKTGSKNCSCSGDKCIQDACQRELIRAMNERGACVLLGKAKSPTDRSFEPWHFEIASSKNENYCFTNADSILNSLGGTGF